MLFDMEGKSYTVFIIEIFGNPTHIVRFVRFLKLTNPYVEIVLFSDRHQREFPQELFDNIDGFIKWKRRNKLPFGIKQFSVINKWFNTGTLFLQLFQLSKKRHFDIVNIHFPQWFLGLVMKLLKRMSTTIVVSPWGSDVLRLEGKRKRRQLAKVFQKADYITVGLSGDVGKTIINEMRIGKSKFHPLAWGSETIDYINDHISDISTEEAKRKLGLSDRYVITCGYNAFEEQRHEVMIKTIATIKHQLPDNLTLLFPVTYGYSYGTKKNDYVEQIKRWCKESNLDAIFFEEYLPVEDVFNLRQGTDLFIHIQTTDAGNSSLQEYVLCGKKVVHGTWIHYANLEKYKPLFYFPVEDLLHLDEAILNAYHSENIKVPTEVMEYIQNRGWKAKMKLWDDFFVSIC